MENRIATALTKMFTEHRIVFWYDAKAELRNAYDTLNLPGIEKIELANNEYGVKYRILREAPEQKFLLYREGPEPAYLDNWLLDVQLAHVVFRTDQVGLWLAELKLGPEFAELVQEHAEFFRATKRLKGLKRLLQAEDTHSGIRLKMLAVCAAADPRIDNILEELLAELAWKRDEKQKLLVRCGLAPFLYEQMRRHYGYDSTEPGIRDFVIELFKSCYAMSTDGRNVRLNSEALVFLKRWKDSRKYEAAFEKLSGESAEHLGMEQTLSQQDFRDVIELDYFQLIDLKIISDLVAGIVSQTLPANDIAVWVRQRQQSHWYLEFQDLYAAVNSAAAFTRALDDARLEMNSLSDGISKYCESWFRIDQYYRKFIYHVQAAGQSTLMQNLSEMIEQRYSNTYLLKLNNRWQELVDTADKWSASPAPLQKNFYRHWVSPFLERDNKIFVIISDALRYEIAEELVGLIRQEDRYAATIKPMLSMLPSYTQLGMAALLPNQTLTLSADAAPTVQVDGTSTQGIANRRKILQQAAGKPATALKADDLMALTREDLRALFREHDVVYVYHNRVDAVGDKRESEERVFEAAEDALSDLVKLVKKATAANASNLLITADHGFIYQHQPLDASDFSMNTPNGAHIIAHDRRFIIGKDLQDAAGLRKFSPAALSLAGDVEIQIPKSINRLRLKGSGSRYVHGGAALQEVVVPVIEINKKRQSDTSNVDVEILRGASTVITAGQLAVVLYQTQAVTDKVQRRCLRAGIYTQSNELISDAPDLVFDFTSENPRERELPVRFLLSREADKFNGQEVVLKLEEKVGGTSHYKEYKSLRYELRRSFTSDFDF